MVGIFNLGLEEACAELHRRKVTVKVIVGLLFEKFGLKENKKGVHTRNTRFVVWCKNGRKRYNRVRLL